MPKDLTLRKVLIIGSGPIVIGQAAEFDYAGTQACLACREEGVEVVAHLLERTRFLEAPMTTLLHGSTPGERLDVGAAL